MYSTWKVWRPLSGYESLCSQGNEGCMFASGCIGVVQRRNPSHSLCTALYGYPFCYSWDVCSCRSMLESFSRSHVEIFVQYSCAHNTHLSCLATDVVASDYLRAFQVSGEMSERALAITRLVLEYNPSHYTAWWFRRR